LLFGGTSARADVTSGLIGLYTFDAGNVADTSGHGLNGVLAVSTAFGPGVGRSGQALKIAAVPAPGGAAAPPAAFAQTAGRNHNATESVAYTVAGATAQYVCVDADFGLTPNAWHHVALTFDAALQTATVYLDGTMVRACPYSGTLAAGSVATTLGFPFNQQLSDTGAFTGSIDDVRFYERALSAADVRELFTNQE
jgi:hypothetical protein